MKKLRLFGAGAAAIAPRRLRGQPDPWERPQCPHKRAATPAWAARPVGAAAMPTQTRRHPCVGSQTRGDGRNAHTNAPRP
jgi:hypothetical protein